MFVATNWEDYELVDAGGGEKLERWGSFLLRRPDPEAFWSKTLPTSEWDKADGYYNRKDGAGKWHWKNKVPESWQIRRKDLGFVIRTKGFKHTGLFPEQAIHWEWLQSILTPASIVSTRETGAKVLNLFGYTGGSTLACASVGANVTHVDASKGIVSWAKENLIASGLGNAPVRFIVDDVFKFVAREERRGNRYHGIIMDPPVYGRGTKGEAWKIDEMLLPLVKRCKRLLTDKPLFFLLNTYVSGISPTTLHNIMRTEFPEFNNIQSGELGLVMKSNGLTLPAGSFVRWTTI
ncbi:MAG: SAM-dependent methyltransferase [Candidatus Vogelbacteria bacterium CG10_big_fil_rev_8_21_14_0_10_45_14]|uniref:SAM-dependent methyltransferase n=1 Tax=Candidatus Vogelbacteria bacterium CG10_big_fil_rev_8_21_14_0_10_45_14 TaxID=1975042 RepID=A0A2H0RKN7_9BACT|nr:MAG: SAM-dependent methyltransferase [Candidatus Vogelbacteria bacterium CG10_big_fil_rev_8_21_14_0_10_45_14]